MQPCICASPLDPNKNIDNSVPYNSWSRWVESQFHLCPWLWPHFTPTHTHFFLPFLLVLLSSLASLWTVTNRQTTGLAKTAHSSPALTVIRCDCTNRPEPQAWKLEEPSTESFVAITDKYHSPGQTTKTHTPPPPLLCKTWSQHPLRKLLGLQDFPGMQQVNSL